MFTWESSILKDHKLITSGPYSIVRHPAYLGLLSVSVGYVWFLWTSGTFGRECFIGGTAGFPPTLMINERNALGLIYAIGMMSHFADTDIFLVRRSFEEDQMLKGKFGKEWEEWARNVRYNVIPFVL
jgi:protein-S-isoprenylcysteine O-methyltransferase Ste14